MCGRFALDSSTDALIREFVVAGGDYNDWTPAWNISPTDPVAVIIETPRRDGGDDSDGSDGSDIESNERELDAADRNADQESDRVRRLEIARWSLVPSWSKELKMKFPTFNARSETAAEKSMFAASVRSKRAIIPATGYYEWRTDPDTNVKTPFFIRPADGELMAMAGLYTWWKDRTATGDDDGWRLTATILTSDAVETLDHIHDRNPVPIPESFWDVWLDPTVVGDQGLVDEAVRAALPVAESLEWYEVGPVKGDGPELIERLR
jgi:putative SOS response-associated peptidase YedK